MSITTGVVECDNAEIPMSPAPVVAVAVSAVAVSITPECDIYPTAEAEAVFGINLAARPAPNNSDRAPVDCVVVLDVSGSMEIGGKIVLMRKTVQLLLAQFTDKDRVGIVTFDTNVSEPVLLQPMTVASKARAIEEIGKLKPGYATNLSGGLFQGIRQLLRTFGLFQRIQQLLGATQDADDSGRVRTCLLMTDGEATLGCTTAAEIVPVLASMIRDTGITLHTFGYGSDHDSGLLRALSTAGSGSYYFVEGVNAIRGAFGDCLGGILSVVAQNLQLIIEAENGAVITKVHHKSAHAESYFDGGRAFRVPFADLYGDEQRDVLVSLRLPVAAALPPVAEPGRGGNAPAAMPAASVAASVVLRATLRYIDLLNAAPTTATAASGVTRASGEVAERAVRNNRIELQATRLRVAEALDAARAAAERRDLPAARAIVAAAQASLLSVQTRCASAPGAADMMKAFKHDLEKCVQGLRDDRAFEYARHEMANASEGHYQQRCMKSNDKYERAGSASAYKTSSKSAMASKFNSVEIVQSL
jgi:Mg-chelatase subunit ChlD